MIKRGTSNVPLILGIIGAVLSLPNFICAATAGLVVSIGSESAGALIFIVGTIPVVLGFVSAFLGRPKPTYCGIGMFVSAAVSLAFLILTAFTSFITWAALILFVIAGIFAFVQEMEYFEDDEYDDEEYQTEYQDKDLSKKTYQNKKIIETNDNVHIIPVLISLSGYYEGNRIELGDEQVSIGRDPDTCQLIFPNDRAKISRRHCTVSFDSQRVKFLLQDHSTNGTFLDYGNRLEHSHVYELESGSRFYLSDKSNLFEVRLEQ